MPKYWPFVHFSSGWLWHWAQPMRVPRNACATDATGAITEFSGRLLPCGTGVPPDPTIQGSTAANSPFFGLLNTRAVLGKQLGSRWFLGLSTGLCFVNPSAFKENLGLQLEYRISSLYTAQAAIEPGSSSTRCDKGITPTITPTQTPPQLGFDLFRNWRF